MNFSTSEAEVDLASLGGLKSGEAEVALATYPDFAFDGAKEKLKLRGYEGVLFVQR